jgi:vitamin B12/bleomycin/antimicrobial peptide transport system ATP-binding/permease protein
MTSQGHVCANRHNSLTSFAPLGSTIFAYRLRKLMPTNRTVADLFRVYWFSRNATRGTILFALVIGAGLFAIWVQTLSVDMYGGLFDALQKADGAKFKSTLIQFSAVMLVSQGIPILGTYLSQLLEIDWRGKLTESYLGRWLPEGTTYRIERDQTIDNPDQRIADDIKLFVQKTLALGPGLLMAVIYVFTFLGTLWKQSGPFNFDLAGSSWSIPGYLVWATLAFVLIITLITRWAGRPLIGLTVQQQHVEADFRFALVQVREHAEQIALYRGATTETQRLLARFQAIRNNWRPLIAYMARLQFVASAASGLAGIFMYVVLGPRVLSGAITLGDMQIAQQSFSLVFVNLGWFVSSYPEIVQWQAIVKRLSGLDRAIDAPQVTGIRITQGQHREIAAVDLSLALPNGQPLVQIAGLQVEPAQRWLISGPSGIGKSTLLRAIAGIWPYGTGSISTPASTSMLFLPQRSYLPTSKLKATLAYPAGADEFSDEACRQALTNCGLSALADRLTEETRWEQQLSPGEQQRLAFARALLIRPEFLILDEATSALDVAAEEQLYELLLRELPDTALISVAHRKSVDVFHTNKLQLG